MKTYSDRDRVELLLQHSLASNLFPSQIADQLLIYEYEPEETIIDINSDVQNLLFLVEGRAKLYSDQSNGRTLLVDFLEYPSIFGEWEMRGNTPNCTIKAITPSTCLALPFDVIKNTLYDSATFWRTLGEINSIKTQRQISHCIKTITFPLEARCAYYIYYNSYNSYYRAPHTEASAYLGVSYRHLLHTIDTFIKRGIMKKTDTGYQITDSDALLGLIK